MLDLPESTTRSQLKNIPIRNRYNDLEPGECMPLPEHLRPGFAGFKNPFKDNLPECESETQTENVEVLVDENEGVTEEKNLVEVEGRNEAEMLLQKIRRKLPPVRSNLVVENSHKVGEFTVKVMKAG
ncbi:MAG: hypothetical protein M0D57_01220 [Sphingobacteriales bacterium JAD_PAG50586_3]|nr:MAG: hypothetical protein M0D57_01220 [Sphingobacteriales bacterium JAD_PAG50586_3]